VWDEDIIAIIGFFTTAIVICVPLVRGLVRRWDRKSIEPASSADTAARLERIDAMAVEVERISEGQRFVTRLMSEQAQERMALPVRSDGR
jgi:hypothetical protein